MTKRRGVIAGAAVVLCATLGPTTWASAADNSGAGADAATVSWTADLTSRAATADNVRAADGLAIANVHRSATFSPGVALASVVSAPQLVGRPAVQVRAEPDASVPAGAGIAIDVRGQRVNGDWTEWREVKAGATVTLPTPAASVQARVTLTTALGRPGPVLRSVRLTATLAASRARAADATRAGTAGATTLAASPLTYRVYATREGLVGHTTANGHVIVANDHFVALPSRRALSPNGSSQYSVRVCNPANGRCETAPVWDVGPWNTKDDYWNPPSVRQMWNDLPQGRPEAQAAYQNGYNAGKDEFGRRVANPAGIDLADGTFYGLGLSNNGWVDVTYLWTGATPGSWPTVRNGATGEDVRTIQYLLNYHGASLSVDGDFGSATTSAVRSFQSSKGLTVDGVVGQQTWTALIVTVRRGSKNNAVRAVQSQLTAHGIATTVDGDFGAGTEASVRTFQQSRGLTVDGVVGPATWQALVG